MSFFGFMWALLVKLGGYTCCQQRVISWQERILIAAENSYRFCCCFWFVLGFDGQNVLHAWLRHTSSHREQALAEEVPLHALLGSIHTCRIFQARVLNLGQICCVFELWLLDAGQAHNTVTKNTTNTLTMMCGY